MADYIIVGFMGAGKTTTGQLLASVLEAEFNDIDEVIVNSIKMSIADYFAAFGEAAFREKEHNTLTDLIASPGILATGGGIIINEANRELLKETSRVVYLTAEPEVTLERIREDLVAVRPLAVEKTPAQLIELANSRKEFYAEVATWTIDTSALTPMEVVQKIIQLDSVAV